MGQKLLKYTFKVFIFLCALPFILLFTMLEKFWKIFGVFLITFIILLIYGLPMDESVGLSGILGILIALYFTFKKEYEKYVGLDDDYDC